MDISFFKYKIIITSLITLFVFCLLLSVTQLLGQNNLKPKVLDLSNISKVKDKINTTDIFELVEFIPLETNINCLTTFSNTVVTENEIFLFSQGQGCILKFNRKGNFIRKIGRRGRGPGEFCFPLRSDIQYYNNNIYLFDSDCMKILKYSTDEKGYHEIFLDKKTQFGGQADVLNDDCFLIADFNPFSTKSTTYYELLSFNFKGNLIHKFPLNPNTTKAYSMYPFIFWHYNDDIFYKSTYCDTAFQVINSKKIEAKYIFSVGKNRYESKGIIPTNDLPKGIVFMHISETSRYLLIECVSDGYNRVAYDKKTNKFFKVNTFIRLTEDPVSQSKFLWPRALIRCESKVPGEYVTCLEPLALVGVDINSLNIGSERVKTKLLELQKKVDENSNPIVVIMKEKRND